MAKCNYCEKKADSVVVNTNTSKAINICDYCWKLASCLLVISRLSDTEILEFIDQMKHKSV